MSGDFDICIVAQAGRLSYEAVLFAASLRAAAPEFRGRLLVGVPNAGPLWPEPPGLRKEVQSLLTDLGAEILPFDSRYFGSTYPYGNKVELLLAMEPGRPFLFFDTDTLITGPLETLQIDFDRPSASMAREDTWPVEPLYGPDRGTMWKAVYDRAGVPMAPTLDERHPPGHWERHLYFNAGWFYAACPETFGRKMAELMVSLRDAPPPELACQSFDPWLDQIALPVVIADLGGGRPGPELDGLDGSLSLHWRALPLLYAKADDATVSFLHEITGQNRIKKVLKLYDPFKRMIYQGRGQRVRDLFDRSALPRTEKVIRNRIKRAKLWMR